MNICSHGAISTRLHISKVTRKMRKLQGLGYMHKIIFQHEAGGIGVVAWFVSFGCIA